MKGYSPSNEGPKEIKPPDEPPIKERIEGGKFYGAQRYAHDMFRYEEVCLLLRPDLPSECTDKDCRICDVAIARLTYIWNNEKYWG